MSFQQFLGIMSVLFVIAPPLLAAPDAKLFVTGMVFYFFMGLCCIYSSLNNSLDAM